MTTEARKKAKAYKAANHREVMGLMACASGNIQKPTPAKIGKPEKWTGSNWNWYSKFGKK